MLFRSAWLGSAALLALACAGPGEDAPLDLRVEWGLTGTSALPGTIDTIRVLTCTIDEETASEVCVPTNCSVAGLTGRVESESCHPARGTEGFGDEPVLVRRNLPTRTPVRFFLEGQDEGGVVTHVGQAGPFILGEGERRQVRIRMWSVNESAGLPGEDFGRFLHTTTWLPDGRLLVAGGFDTLTTGACPAEPALPEGTQCFRARATSSALAVEVGSGRVTPIRNAMLAARGGHTATALPDGRVLLVGGATDALLAFAPIGAADSGRFDVSIYPIDSRGSSSAHASFEVFDAYLGHRTDDPDRDGDPGRGGFLGVAGSTEPGATNQPRFFHAAAAVPSEAGRVVIVGGMGGADSAATFEVFDANRAGGYGVYRASGNRLRTPRVAPSAVGLRGRVWIFGGALAADDAALAEVWEGGADPNGVTEDATEGRDFPSSTRGMTQNRPEYALMRPAVAAIAGGDAALVVGWYGPRCEPDGTAPRFFDPASPTETCAAPVAPATRSYTVSANTGVATPTDVRAQSFAEVALTQDFDPTREGFRERIVLLGGISNLSWTSQRNAEVFSGARGTGGEATRLAAGAIALRNGRTFHTSTGVPGLGVVSVGGIEFMPRTGARIVRDVEVVFLHQ